MRIKSIKHIVAVIAVLTISALNVTLVKADTIPENGSLIYNNRGYVQAFQSYSNPIADYKVQGAEIIYVSYAYGPAIYSYPSSVAFQHTDFNVEYVDTAYGPAIYSYPSNRKAKHRLNLVANEKMFDDKFITPTSLRLSNYPVSAAE